MSRLGVTEGLTTLDANGTADPRARRVLEQRQGRHGAGCSRCARPPSRTAPRSPPRPSPPPSPTPPGPSPRPPPSPASPSPPRPWARTGCGSPPHGPTRCCRCGCRARAWPILSPKAYEKNGTVEPGRHRHRPLRAHEDHRRHGGHPDRFDDYWGGLAQASGHRRPVHRRRHRPRQRPAHRPGRHRRGDPRRPGRLPGQGHRPRDGHRPHHQPAPQHQVRRLQGPRAARRRPRGHRHLRTRQGRLRGIRRPRPGHLRPRPDLGRGKRVAARRTGEGHQPRRQEHHPRHLRQPARAARSRPGAASSSWRRPGSRSSWRCASTRGSKATCWPGSSTPP